jgi:murein tripeptide amidase MpaA
MKNILLNILKKENENILNNSIIKLIPMVNPDGVVIGNSRCSLAGVDLN